MAVLEGMAPVVTFRNYQRDVTAYTKGHGRLFCSLKGYEPCHNAEEVIERIGYDSERDTANPTGSVFCSGGAGFLVNWDEVKDYMHLPGYFEDASSTDEEEVLRASYKADKWLPAEEVDRILNQTSFANQGKKSVWSKRRTTAESFHKPVTYTGTPRDIKEEYLLVDGYNIIFAWPELKELAKESLDSARLMLLDILTKYQGIRGCQIIAVFDAYRVQGHAEEILDYDTIHVVYTREAQTADQFIEKFAHDNQKKYSITVATSDYLQQIIIRGAGSAVMSARELKVEIERVNSAVLDAYREKQTVNRNSLKDALSDEAKEQMKNLLRSEDPE